MTDGTGQNLNQENGTQNHNNISNSFIKILKASSKESMQKEDPYSTSLLVGENVSICGKLWRSSSRKLD